MSEPVDPKFLPAEVDVKNHRAARKVVLTWEDGHRAAYPYEYLRGHCPCASCQGHFQKATFKRVAGATLREVGLVGSYAFSMAWTDGHDTGIYTFRKLREMCPCTACRPEGVPELVEIGVVQESPEPSPRPG